MTATSIEWTDRVWNPTTGCDRVSPGCDHCYALTLAKRLQAMGQPAYQNDGDPATSGPGFGLTLHPERLAWPRQWRRPARIFVNSMSDLFHADVPATFIEQVWEEMSWASQHTFQILTKRAERMERVVGNLVGEHYPPRNVWLGVSVESPAYYSRIRHLQRTPAAVRWLSLEPLLERLPDLPLDGIDWVVAGGESGPGARPMHPAWVREIRDSCAAAGIPFLFKQWGAWVPVPPPNRLILPVSRFRVMPVPDGCAIFMERVGKHAAGRLLDGELHDGFPRV